MRHSIFGALRELQVGEMSLVLNAKDLGVEADDAAASVQRADIGDAEHFASVVAEHQAALVGYLFKMTRCPERARELAQESFVRLFLRRDSYQEQGLVAAYLFRIATNLLRSEERRKARWRRLEPTYKASLVQRSESPQGALESEEASRRVTAAIAELPLKFRAPLVLREIEGWPYSRIAETLGCREGTAKSRVNRAKKRLKGRLESFWKSEVQRV